MDRLTKASRFIYEVANLNFRENQPFVGAAAFAHKGGMHVHAVQRKAETYEHMDPAAVGNTRRILVSELSGVSNIAAKAPAKFCIAQDKAVQKKVLSALMEQENQGYQFEASEASFEMLIRRTLGEKWYRKLWELDHYRCVISKHGANKAGTEATVKLAVGGKSAHTVAEGDGPVDSLRKALCAALRSHYPAVDSLHLVDYKVRVVNTAAETAAKVRVVIDWHDEKDLAYFGSVGVSENIVDASWLALVDAIEYKVFKE
jgi:2-isopropylmalate synthase